MTNPQTESLRRQLKKLINDDGYMPDRATEIVLARYPDAKPLADHAQSSVLATAWQVYNEKRRNTENLALSTAARTDRQLDARMQLPRTTFRVGNGTEVDWGTASPIQHRMRAAWMRQQAAGYLVGAERHERAGLLIEQRGVSCLDEIDDWQDMLRDPEIEESASSE